MQPSKSSQRPHKPLSWKTTAGFFGTLIALVIIGSVALLWVNHTHNQAIDQMTDPDYGIERDSYELDIRASNNPKPAPAADLAVIDGQVFVYRDSDDRCWEKCVLIQPVDGGYAVTLSAVYRPVGHNSDLSGDSLGKVVELTYWDPQQHRKVTKSASSGETVAFPSVLSQDRTVADVQVGQIAYVIPAAVRWTENGPAVANSVSALYEPHDDLLFGTMTSAALYRTEAGFEVCIPEAYDAGDIAYGTLPPSVPNDRTLIYQDDMNSTPVTLLDGEVC